MESLAEELQMLLQHKKSKGSRCFLEILVPSTVSWLYCDMLQWVWGLSLLAGCILGSPSVVVQGWCRQEYNLKRELFYLWCVWKHVTRTTRNSIRRELSRESLQHPAVMAWTFSYGVTEMRKWKKTISISPPGQQWYVVIGHLTARNRACSLGHSGGKVVLVPLEAQGWNCGVWLWPQRYGYIALPCRSNRRPPNGPMLNYWVCCMLYKSCLLKLWCKQSYL